MINWNKLIGGTHQRRRVGLVLGSGGARGMAHLGVLQRFAEWGVPIDCVAGVSIGAIIGAVFCAGKVDEVATWASSLDWREVAKLFVGRPHSTGILTGKRIDERIRSFVPFQTFADSPIPLATVATDAATGEEVVFTEGNLLKAVHASFSIPGVFTAVDWHNRQLVDGGVVNPLPISVCREKLGADIIIAVDLNLRSGVNANEHHLERLNIFHIMANALGFMEKEASRAIVCAQAPDILLQPAVADIAMLDFTRAEEAIVAGRAVADEMHDSIISCLNEFGVRW